MLLPNLFYVCMTILFVGNAAKESQEKRCHERTHSDGTAAGERSDNLSVCMALKYSGATCVSAIVSSRYF